MGGGVVAHVRYVTERGEGPDISVRELFAAAFDPVGSVIAGVLVLFLVLYAVVLPRLRGWGSFRATLSASLHEYHHYLPWILRLSAGIALMGAALSGYLFVPHIETSPRGLASLVMLAAGFVLLVGVAVRLAALAALMVWGYTIATHGLDALMAIETVVALVALTALSAGRPSLDDLFALTFPSAPRPIYSLGRLRVVFGPEASADVSVALTTWVPVLLRVGLGVSLLYAGLTEKWLDPGPAVATAVKYDLAVGPLTPELWVVMAGLVEIAIGIGLIIGAAVRPLSAAAFLVLTLTLFALPDDPVLAHVPLWGLASAVFILGCGPWSVDRERMRRAVQAEA